MRAPPFVLLFGVALFFAALVPGYLAPANLTQLLTDYAEPALVAIAMAVTVIGGGIDLTVGAVFALADLAALVLFRVEGCSLATTILAVLGLGVMVGAANGLLVAALRLRPFLTTLAMALILRGIYDLLSQTYAVPLAAATHDGPVWNALGAGLLVGVPFNALYVAGVGLVVHLLLTRTRLGAHVMAVGSDAVAAARAGVHVARTRAATYLLSATIAATAGVFYAARQDAAASNLGAGWEIGALAAVVLGGVSLSGGRGSVPQAMVGAGIIFLLTGGLLRLNMPGNAASAVVGGALLVGVCLARALPLPRRRGLRTPAPPSDAGNATINPQQNHVPARSNTPYVRLIAGCKNYAGVRVLDDVDLAFHRGEMHAIVGENGAGKSTLAKMIAGCERLSSGRLIVANRECRFASPADSLAAGIVTVYQETSLAPDLSVARNLVLGREPWAFAERRLAARAAASLTGWGGSIDPLAPAGSLGPAQRQIVEIVRAVGRDGRMLIFDEPTAALTPGERKVFFQTLANLRARRIAVVLVTHAIEEALRHADHVTIMRDGRCVHSGAADALTKRQVVDLMIGGNAASLVAPHARKAKSETPEMLMSVKGLSLASGVAGIEFDLRAGEVLGLAGLVGAGRTEIAKAIAALDDDAIVGGTVRLRSADRGDDIALATPTAAVRAGVVYVTEDRQAEGTFESLSAEDNIVLGALVVDRRVFYPFRNGVVRLAGGWMERLGVDRGRRRRRISHYSGGNQQRIVLARALSQNPRVVILDEPTRGVDIGTIATIHDTIRRLADEGRAVLVISSDVPELLHLCDRILALRGGRIAARFDAGAAIEGALMAAIAS